MVNIMIQPHTNAEQFKEEKLTERIIYFKVLTPRC